MDSNERLIQACIMWDELVRAKEKRVKKIQHPLLRIIPTIDLVNRKIELRSMVDELASRITLDFNHAVHLGK